MQRHIDRIKNRIDIIYRVETRLNGAELNLKACATPESATLAILLRVGDGSIFPYTSGFRRGVEQSGSSSGS